MPARHVAHRSTATVTSDRERSTKFPPRISRCQTLAHGPVVQELCNGSKRTQMRLKLIFRHDEKDDEFHRRVIERIKLNTVGGSSESGNDLIEPVRRTMWNGDPESYSCAHSFLALSKRGKNGVAICGFYFAKTNEQIDQFDDGRPALRCFHLWDDLLGRK